MEHISRFNENKINESVEIDIKSLRKELSLIRKKYDGKLNI